MGAFDGLHVEVESSCIRVRAYGGIARVCEGTRLTVAETSDIVFVAAEVLFFGRLKLKGAELLIDDLRRISMVP